MDQLGVDSTITNFMVSSYCVAAPKGLFAHQLRLKFWSSLEAILSISPRCSSIMKHDQSHLHGISFEFECDLSVVFSTLTHVWKSECLDRLA